MRRKKWLSASLLALGIAGGSFLGYSAYSDHDLTKNLETLFVVLRDAMLMDVDEPDPEQLISGGILGMLRSLDPYTEYIPESSKEAFQFITTGEYAGIGAMIQTAGAYTQIAQLYDNTPAVLAGIKVGDTIVAIDGQNLKGVSVNDVSAKLKGKENSKLTITLNRPYGEQGLAVEVKRKRIQIPSVAYSTLLPGDLAYVNLDRFTDGCSKEIEHALAAMTPAGKKLSGLILDLRGNVGGLFNEAVDLVSLFVPPGTKVVDVRGRDPENVNTVYSSGSAPYRDLPVVVLVNRESASSSEIVAGAFQDLDRALIVGEQTFGKGLVQSTRPLPHGGVFKITTAKYYTPSGRCIQAIDYARRNANGGVESIPDSLMRDFQTRGGRTVYDGGGIWPDIPITGPEYSPLVASLYVNSAFYDYANRYQQRQTVVPDLKDFTLTERDMSDFLSLVKEKGYAKKNAMFDEILRLEKMGKEAELSDSLLSTPLTLLRARLDSAFFHYYHTHAAELKELLSQEIISRYYYRAGRLAFSLHSDSVFLRGVSLLQQPDSMQFYLRRSPVDMRRESVSSRKKAS